MSKRALIIGTDRDYCYIIKEFLELRDLSATVVLNYKDGLDRLFYEKPDLTVLELLEQEPSPALIGSISSSQEFETVDFTTTQKINKQAKPVLIFEDKTHINSLFDFLKINFSDQEANESPPKSENEGNLGSTFYPELLVDIYHKKQSGILSLSSRTNLHIYFTNGAPVFAEGGDIETAIGRILLDRGRIDQETYEKAIEMSSGKKLKFGEILFEMGITSPHELNSFLELQIEEKILNGFYYLNGNYEFVSGSDFADRIVSYRIDLPKVIYEGVKRYIDAESIEEEDPFIEISPGLKREINTLGLKPTELRFVQLLKNKASVKETLKAANLEKKDALKLLYFLALFRLLSISDISTDEIGRMSMEKRIKEKDALPDGGRTEGLELDEEGFFTIEKGSAATPEDLPAKTEEGSLSFEKNILSGTSDAETGVSPESPEERENREYHLTDKSENQNEEEHGAQEAGLINGTLEKDTDEIEIESDYFSELFEEKTKNEIPDEDPIKSEPASRNDDFHFNSAEDEDNKDMAIEFSDDTPGINTDEKHISLEPEQDNSLRQMGLGEEKTETADELGHGNNHTENDTNAPEGFEARKAGQDYSQPYDDTELELHSQGQPNGEERLSDGFTAPTGTIEVEAENTDSDAPGNKWQDFKETGYAADEETVLPVNELDINQELPAIQHSEDFAKRVNEFHAAIQGKDYYEILGVGPDVSSDEIKNAYYDLVKHYHPDVNPNAEQAVREMAEEIFTKITSAYETLKEPDKREQYDSREELAELKSNAKYIYEAEVAFKKGVTLLAQRDYVQAGKKIAEALNMNPEEAAYIGTHAWTMFLAADDKSKVLDEVRKSLEKAIAINEKIPENYYYLGSIYKYNEDLKKAENYYNKALELDPDYIEAKREIRLINTRKIQNVNQRKVDKRFWSSLFKK